MCIISYKEIECNIFLICISARLDLVPAVFNTIEYIGGGDCRLKL